jgi:hypothetical protein
MQMMTRLQARFTRRFVSILLAVCVSASSGCATLAHRNSNCYEGKEKVTSCEQQGSVCPWLVGDALLLIPGVIPGVIAFVVDFGTGAWQHDDHGHGEGPESARFAGDSGSHD